MHISEDLVLKKSISGPIITFISLQDLKQIENISLKITDSKGISVAVRVFCYVKKIFCEYYAKKLLQKEEKYNIIQYMDRRTIFMKLNKQKIR